MTKRERDKEGYCTRSRTVDDYSRIGVFRRTYDTNSLGRDTNTEALPLASCALSVVVASKKKKRKLSTHTQQGFRFKWKRYKVIHTYEYLIQRRPAMSIDECGVKRYPHPLLLSHQSTPSFHYDAREYVSKLDTRIYSIHRIHKR